MKGSLHTDELMGAVVRREAGLRTARRVSHCFVMDVPSTRSALIISDAAINIAPTLEDKVDIVQNAIDLGHALRFPEVRVAILSAMETVNPKVPSTIEAAALCKMADRHQITGGIVDGPLALDNAISLEVGEDQEDRFAGRGARERAASCPISKPGNMLAKSLSFLAGADAAGIVLGAQRADHPDEPRRFGDDAARVLRALRRWSPRRAARARAKRCSEPVRRRRWSERRIVEHQVLASSRMQRRRARTGHARPGGRPVHVAAFVAIRQRTAR